jgi:DNA-binding NarL/FixJ family response regulator
MKNFYRALSERTILILTLLCVGTFEVYDIISDLSEGESLTHLAVECVIAVAVFSAVITSSLRTRKLKLEAKHAHANAALSAAEAIHWKKEASQFAAGVSEAIDKQFQRWNITVAEKEVALLLIKGLSLKEIAEVRSVSEKTVRSQAVTVYSKSGTAGRAELSAFFLEDLLMPNTQTASTPRNLTIQ